MTLGVEFDNARTFYCGGDLVVGKAVITHILGKPSDFAQFLGIKFVGQAWTKWREGRQGRTHLRQHMVTIGDKEIYYEKSITLFPPNLTNMEREPRELDPNNAKEISTGRTEFPFMFQLPENLASTFEGKHGSIVYSLEVLYRRLGKPDKVTKVNIHVSGNYDLNLEPKNLQPGTFLMEKKLWWWLGSIHVRFKLLKRAFLRGETLDFCLEVKNSSTCNLTKISVHLTQIATFTAQGSTRSDFSKITKTNLTPILPREEKNLEGSLKIPDHISPTTWNAVQIVQIAYSVTVKVKASKFGQITNDALLEGRVPIVIGSVGFTVRPCQEVPGETQVSLPFVLSTARSLRRVVLQDEPPKYNRRNKCYEKPPEYDDAVPPEADITSPTTMGTGKFFSIA